MSRLGKKPIIIPQGTTVSLNNSILSVKGPLGELKREFRPEIEIKINGSEIATSPRFKTLEAGAFWGTTVAHIKNMIAGVNKAYEGKLLVEGIGYKSDVKGSELVLSLGFSHQVKVDIPKDVKVVVDKTGAIIVSGIDKEKVGQFLSTVKRLKKPEPYKGKGIRYDGEIIKRKQGKKAA